jgi:hypothetical protein
MQPYIIIEVFSQEIRANVNATRDSLANITRNVSDVFIQQYNYNYFLSYKGLIKRQKNCIIYIARQVFINYRIKINVNFVIKCYEDINLRFTRARVF